MGEARIAASVTRDVSAIRVAHREAVGEMSSPVIVTDIEHFRDRIVDGVFDQRVKAFSGCSSTR
jgi:hypothetical protein